MKPLYPIMAALLTVSVGALPHRAWAGETTTATETKPENDPLVVLRGVFEKKPEAREDAGARFARYILGKDSKGRTYAADDLLADDKLKNAVTAAATKWAKEAKVEEVTELYAVMEPDAPVPAWVKNDPLLTRAFPSQRSWKTRLEGKLDAWAEAKISARDAANGTGAFLDEAAKFAREVILDPRSAQELRDSIAANNTTTPVVPGGPGGSGTGNRRNGNIGSSQQYSFADLYENGAIVQNVYGEGDEGARRISMKMYTRRLEDGTVVNEIGVFDITDPNDVYGRRFPVKNGEVTFPLDDRTAGHKQYTLKLATQEGGTDQTLFFGRKGSKPGDPGSISYENPNGPEGQRQTMTVGELFKKRADQAAELNNVVAVGGQEFYVVPQGGKNSALLLMPRSLIDAGAADPRDLVPALYAVVGQRGPDGRNQNASGKPHLWGTVGGKEFHLEFNAALGLWEVKDGAGDKPKPPVTPTTGQIVQNPTTPTATQEVSPEDAATLDQVEQLAQAGGWVRDEAANAGLSEATRGKVRIYKREDPREGTLYNILVPPTQFPGGQMQFGSQNGHTLKRMRGLGHYMVIEYEDQKQYVDLDKPKGNGFEMAGFVVMKTKEAQKMVDVVLLLDAMTNYFGIPTGAPAMTTIPERTARRAAGNPYFIQGSMTKDGENEALVATVNIAGKSYFVWPGDQEERAADPNDAGLNGPGNAFDVGPSSEAEEFPDEVNYTDTLRVKAINKSAEIAMYESVNDGAKPDPKKWYMMLKFRSEDSLYRTKLIEVFSEETGKRKLPAGYQMGGLVTADLNVDRARAKMRVVAGTTDAKGVLAAFNTPATGDNQQNKKDNCVGPVIWWGVTRDEAVTACKADKM